MSSSAVDGGNVRVVEAVQHLGLPLEPSETIRTVGEGVGEDLQRHQAVELGVGGLPALSHPALAEEGDHVIVPEKGTGTERHKLLRTTRLYLSGSDSRRVRVAVTKDRSNHGKGVITPWGRHVLYFRQTVKQFGLTSASALTKSGRVLSS